MAAPKEVLMSSEASGQLWNICVWDPQTGTSLISYKGSSSSPRTLCTVAGQYLLSAVNSKPLIQSWAIQRKDQMQQKMVVPGRISAMTVSPDGGYCVAAVAEKIHVWQICTGNLIAVLGRHYQTVSCLCFTDDGSHFVSAGEDNLVMVWSLAKVLKSTKASGGLSSLEPRHLWSSHSLPVTDLYVGHGGPRARVVTSSLDNTCKLWEVASGQMLCSFVFENAIKCVAMDSTESCLFAGSSNGSIYQVNLYEKPVRTERHISHSDEGSLVFTGHKKQVTCLSVSLDGSILASGSHDTSLNIWDVASRQCIRSIPHKGPLTNVLLTPTPPNLLKPDSRPTIPLHIFKRQLWVHGSEEEDGAAGMVEVRIKRHKTEHSGWKETTADICQKQVSREENESDQTDIGQLQQEIANLKHVNQQIFKFSVDKILNGNCKKS